MAKATNAANNDNQTDEVVVIPTQKLYEEWKVSVKGDEPSKVELLKSNIRMESFRIDELNAQFKTSKVYYFEQN